MLKPPGLFKANLATAIGVLQMEELRGFFLVSVHEVDGGYTVGAGSAMMDVPVGTGLGFAQVIGEHLSEVLAELFHQQAEHEGAEVTSETFLH